ncbi:hypothetical protein QP938_08050 [Porticoccaceae bacterium LTM1]|nr:hypothetical protein QP938_08050 [Porticoccaceae bacterium LTM1]
MKNNHSYAAFWLPLLCALLPFVALHAGFIVAAQSELISWCVPYWDGCASVSKVGRQLPITLIYRGLIIPGMVMGALFWLLVPNTLTSWSNSPVKRSMMLCGVLGCLFIVVYCVALGEQDRVYRLFRYAGVMFGVGFTVAAQILMTKWLKREISTAEGALQAMTICLWSYLIMAFLSVSGQLLLPELYEEYIRSSLEWWLFLLVSLWYLFVSILYSQESVRLRFFQ